MGEFPIRPTSIQQGLTLEFMWVAITMIALFINLASYPRHMGGAEVSGIHCLRMCKLPHDFIGYCVYHCPWTTITYSVTLTSTSCTKALSVRLQEIVVHLSIAAKHQGMWMIHSSSLMFTGRLKQTDADYYRQSNGSSDFSTARMCLI